MIFDKIKTILGESGYVDSPDAMEPYITAWRGGWKGKTPFIAMPKTVSQLAEIVSLCAHAKISMVPQGGNTGLVGGATPSPDGDDLLINLSRMNAIRSFDTSNFTLTAEAGCTLKQVQEVAAEQNLLFPLSMASEGSAQVGGFVSTNAGGTSVLRYGNTRQLVLGIEAVLPSGEVLHDLHTLRKDNTGYDLKQLFIGGEGTLGIITAAAFQLYPSLKQTETLFLALPRLSSAIELLRLFRDLTSDSLTAFELISDPALQLVLKRIPDTRHPLKDNAPYYLLVEAGLTKEGDELKTWLGDALEKAFANELITDGVQAESLTHRGAFWKLRESISEAESHSGRGVHFDISVPISKVPDFVRVADSRVLDIAPKAILVNFGHIGDGNLHYNVCLPKATKDSDFKTLKTKLKEAIYKDVREHGGSISAEHGIGQERRTDLYGYEQRTSYELMQKVKNAIDPFKLMNPGKMLE